MQRPERICSLHRVLHTTGCPKCQATRWQQQDQRRGSSHARGYDKAWARVAKLALQRDQYLCQDCLALGTYTLATEVDHVLPIDTHPHLRLQLDNLRSLCHPHHVAKTRRDKHGQAQAS